MDLRVPWKALSEQGASSSKRVAYSSKRVAFFVLVGLILVVGILLRSGQFFGQPEAEQNAPVTVAAPPPAAAPMPPVDTTESPIKTAPPAQEPATAPIQAQQIGEEPTKQADEAVEHVEQPEPPGSGMLLVSRQPIALLASPSSSAPTMYGFPAGRPFRVIGHDGGFAHIQDLKSSASGWIDEAALAPPPSAPAVSAPSQPKPYSVSRTPPNLAGPKPYSVSRTPPNPAGPKPKVTKNDSAVTADSEAATQPSRPRPGLFGRGGVFGGIFGNGN